MVGEHPQEPAADVRPVDEHPQGAGRGKDEDEAVEPGEVVGHHDSRPGGRQPIGVTDAVPPAGMDDRGDKQTQRRARRAPHGSGGGPEREEREDREDRPGGEHRWPSLHERRPQPAVGQRRQEHATKKEEVCRPEHSPEPFWRALGLEVRFQRHVEHSRPEAEHHQPHKGDPRGRPAGLDKMATDAGQRHEGDAHGKATERHESEIDARIGPLRSRGELAGHDTPRPDAGDEGHEEGHDLRLGHRPRLGGELIDIGLGHGTDRPEKHDPCGGGGQLRLADEKA